MEIIEEPVDALLGLEFGEGEPCDEEPAEPEETVYRKFGCREHLKLNVILAL